ncbi:hypothetical protein SETIT_9G050500v2 [Setaria italica]|nr:hypothetical protein SETIT_9G050500v2 [Setaria italica]
MKLLEIEQGEGLRARKREAEERIRDYDPKQGGVYYTRFYYAYDLASFDHDEESPIPPMRFTNAVYKSNDDYELCEAVNILSMKVGSLDIEFPIHVYGTVIVRDSLDKYCEIIRICHCYCFVWRLERVISYGLDMASDIITLQNNLASSQSNDTTLWDDESLILTGPKRGLALISNAYVETNLIIKGDEKQEDRQLSKGILTIPGMEQRVLIRSCTSSIKERLVLHGRLAYITSGEKIAPIFPLLRSVVAVHVKEKLLLTITAHTEDGEFTKCINCTPRVNGSYLDEVTIGFAALRVKVVWSIIDF